MIIVFYDGKCGLCSREVSYYRRAAPDGIFNWQDITESQVELERAGLTLSDGLRILHAKDDAGVLHKGVGAFILIWRHLKGWRILASIIALPLMRQVADLLYHWFANKRFRRLAHCQLAAKGEK